MVNSTEAHLRGLPLDGLFESIRTRNLGWRGPALGLFLPDSVVRSVTRRADLMLPGSVLGLAAVMGRHPVVARIIARHSLGLDPDALPDLTPDMGRVLAEYLMQHVGGVLRGLDVIFNGDIESAKAEVARLRRLHELFGDGDGGDVRRATDPDLWSDTIMAVVAGLALVGFSIGHDAAVFYAEAVGAGEALGTQGSVPNSLMQWTAELADNLPTTVDPLTSLVVGALLSVSVTDQRFGVDDFGGRYPWATFVVGTAPAFVRGAYGLADPAPANVDDLIGRLRAMAHPPLTPWAVAMQELGRV